MEFYLGPSVISEADASYVASLIGIAGFPFGISVETTQAANVSHFI